MITNLNDLKIITDTSEGEPLVDYSTDVLKKMHVECVFRNLEEKIISLIKEHKDGAIFGSVAWLTSAPILKALSKCNVVQILIQKEDFLRPDYNNHSHWTKHIKELYDNLKCDYNRYAFKYPMGCLDICSLIGDYDAIRCLGNNNFDKKPAFPRAHNKFLVFCKFTEIDKEAPQNESPYKPVALWTGSFNLSKNATYSFENAIILRDVSGDNEIINAYLNEHHQLFALSEPLDWQSNWCEPEYRIGT
jgi:hypothetical protein